MPYTVNSIYLTILFLFVHKTRQNGADNFNKINNYYYSLNLAAQVHSIENIVCEMKNGAWRYRCERCT